MMRLYALLGCIAVAVGIFLGWMIFRDDPSKEKLKTAEQSQSLATETGKVIERTYERTNTIYRQAEGSADVAERARGGDVPVPDDVLSAFRGGVDGLRERSGAGDDRGSAKPAG